MMDRERELQDAMLEILKGKLDEGLKLVKPHVLFLALRSQFPDINDVDIRWPVGTLIADSKILYTFDGDFMLLQR